MINIQKIIPLFTHWLSQWVTHWLNHCTFTFDIQIAPPAIWGPHQAIWGPWPGLACWQMNKFSWSRLNGTLLYWGYRGCNTIDSIKETTRKDTACSLFKWKFAKSLARTWKGVSVTGVFETFPYAWFPLYHQHMCFHVYTCFEMISEHAFNFFKSPSSSP